MRKCLLAVQGPLQFIAGLIALEWYGQVKHDSSKSELVLVLYDFMVPPEVENPLQEAILSIAGVRQWKKVVFISGQEMARIMRKRYSRSVLEMRTILGEFSFDEIFLARSDVGFGSALMLNAYPDATRVIYGDSFGLVGNESELSLLWSWSLKSLITHFKAIIRKLLLGSPVKFSFDAAVLTLPVDYSGCYLQSIPLLVPLRVFALARLKECCDQLPGLIAYCNNLLEGAHNPCLFLLSTLFQSGLMSIEKEIALYIRIIRHTAPQGSTIIMKPHPRGNMAILAAVVNAVEAEYHVKVIDYPQFLRIPIELWTPLIKECTIVSMYSSSSVNLSYLYGKDVVIPLDANTIGEYFYPELVSTAIKDNALNLEAIKNLKTWDGNSPLWQAQ